MEVISRPLSLHTTNDAGGGFHAASFKHRGPDRRQELSQADSQECAEGVTFSEESIEKAFHMSGVDAYLEYYRL